MKKNILIVDDSKSVCAALEIMVSEELGYYPVIAHSKKEAAQKLLEYKGKIAVALLDLGLADAPNGEVVEYVTKFDIPSIVLTGDSDCEDEFRNKDIVDYVVKDNGFAFEYIISLVRKIVLCEGMKVLVVDDSKSAAFYIIDLLKRYRLNCIYAKDGLKAIKKLEENKDIRLIITDYNMPNMDGLELTKNIRRDYPKGKVSYTVSIGYSLEKTKVLDDMVNHADRGLYKAKNSGRNQVRIH